MEKLEAWFEGLLWQMRWAVVVAVFCSGTAAFAMFYVASVDAYYVIDRLLGYASLADTYERMSVRANAIGDVVEVVDGFLLAIVLLIFSFGLYELYISKIDSAYDGEAAKHMLSINSLDDLKSRLGKVILMILIVKFFEIAISLSFEDVYDLLLFAVGIFIIGGSLLLTELTQRKGK
ncbi:MAG: YqhA family protein [Mariprofundaceae bacterium]